MVGRVLVTVLSAAVLMATGAGWRALDSLSGQLATTGALSLSGSDEGDHNDGATDILLVGTDSRSDAQGKPLSEQELATLRAGDVATTNTDTIILIRVPDGGGSATALSIPRDSYVDVAGTTQQAKINGVYGAAKQDRADQLVAGGTDPAATEKPSTEAGRTALIGTVQQLTGVTVDHYAEIGLLGFVLLTDAVGGVNVCLKNPVDEPLSGAKLPAGEQKLGGADALSFVRQRHDLPHGDLDRITRQQVYMASLASQVLSSKTLSSPSRIGALTTALTRSVVIDDGWDVVKFATQLQDIAGGSVKFQTIPVIDQDATSDDGESIVKLDPTQVRAAVATAIGRQAPAPTTTAAPPAPRVPVDVANASGVDGLGSGVAAALTGLGFTTGRVGNYDKGTRAESAVLAASSDDPAAVATATALGGLPVQTDDSLAADQVRVIVGTDYAGPGSTSGGGTTAASDVATASDPAPTTTQTPIAAASSGPRCVD